MSDWVRKFAVLAIAAVIGAGCMSESGTRNAPSSRSLTPGQSLPADSLASDSTPPPAFTLRPGAATDIGVGANGSAWVAGTNPEPGGFGLWHWTGTTWASVAGGATRIAVGPNGDPWIVNSLGRIYHRNGANWTALPGAATDIGVGANGSAWVAGTNPEPGGFGLWHWTGTTWASVAGGATRIAVGPNGDPWIVNSLGRIYHRNGANWTALPGAATDIGVGASGSAWVAGTNPEPGGFGVWHWTGTTWASLSSGGAVRLAVDPRGNPWIVNSSHQILTSAGTTSGVPQPPSHQCTNPVWSTSEATGTDSLDSSGTWWVDNDAWSGSHGPQTINVCNQSSWYAVSNQPNVQGQVETYPNTEYDIGGRNNGLPTKTIAQYNSIQSTFSENFPSAGSWDAAYDMWLNNWGTEIMVWNEYTGTQLYWQTQGTPVTLGGVPYHFINLGGEFIFTRDTMVKSGSVNLLAPMQYLVSQGLVKSTDVPTQLEYGVEVCSTSGSETFPLTGLTFNLS